MTIEFEKSIKSLCAKREARITASSVELIAKLCNALRERINLVLNARWVERRPTLIDAVQEVFPGELRSNILKYIDWVPTHFGMEGGIIYEYLVTDILEYIITQSSIRSEHVLQLFQEDGDYAALLALNRIAILPPIELMGAMEELGLEI